MLAGLSHTARTLPAGIIGAYPYSGADIEEPTQGVSQPSKYSGPHPPKSWVATPAPHIHHTAAWRAQALSLIYTHLQPSARSILDSSVPSLSQLCLRVILELSPHVDSFSADIISFIPPHLRRDLVRYTAVHSPLPNDTLVALFEPEGHADGELIIVGPSASLRGDYFLRNPELTPQSDSDAPRKREESLWDWDSDELTPEPLHTFVLMSTRLAMSTFLSFPPTITHMGLINLPMPISLHRLPGICPLLVVLDLSYNSWLSHATKDATQTLEKVAWTRWGHLRILGFRECHIPHDMHVRVNKGRWDDVEILQ